ncbi:MAG: 3-dehydroquinate synthase [Gammaproteobacteria bacterium]|nr:MAG: 3-dehydroquinate synthase [Gammaproteobacteria bacterium]
MTSVLNVELGTRSYPIFIGRGLLERVGELLTGKIVSRQVVVVTNETIAPLYLDKVTTQLKNFDVEVVILPDGEQFKTINTVNQIFDALIAKKFGRKATLIALGGGVVGDMTGFAAACYQRGVPFIQIPTTLLAQVDSSVGGKTGVNHPRGKNMIGAFHQPEAVLIDTDVLNTLDSRQFSAGLAEVIKYGLIRDRSFFHWLEENIERLNQKESTTLAETIRRCCQSKADIVEEDEHESGVRALLNLGHTFGHAIETGEGYGEYLHGEAVSIGMCMAADMSHRLGWLEKDEVNRISSLLKQANLPVIPPETMGRERFIELMAVDKKNVDGQLRLILLKEIGRATITSQFDPSTLNETLDLYGRE